MTFLATTALSEFWDPSEEILLLGTWCLRASRGPEWKDMRYRVLPSPWNDRKRFYEAARYVEERCERFLERLTDYLNETHVLRRDRRYWRVILGPWLMQHVHQTYDRYVHLREALELQPALTTIVLDPGAYVTPRDSAELAQRADDDLYNLQVISQVLAGLGYRFPVLRPAAVPEVGPIFRNTARDVARRALVRSADALGWWLLGLGYSRAAVCDVYGFPRMALLRASVLRAVPLDVRFDLAPGGSRPRPNELRTGLGALPADDEFERILVATLPQSFPTLYMEAFQRARTQILARYPRLPAVILSSVGWHYNEALKFLAAEAVAGRGARLVAAQHGGGYGIHRFQAQERHEAAIADRFAVWGWAPDDGRHCNAPSSLLADRLGRWRARAATGTVLFVANENFRHVYRLHSLPLGSQHDEWFEWELRFLASVPERLRPRIIFRAYVQDFDHGFAIRERVARQFPEVRIDSRGRFERAAAKSRLLVIDHCGTTLLQALAAGKPTVAYWDPQRWEAREEAEPYLDRLREAGILWDSPEAAAAQVAAVYEDVAAWWEAPPVAEARRRFAERFALARADWRREWVRLLEAEAALAPAATRWDG